MLHSSVECNLKSHIYYPKKINLRIEPVLLFLHRTQVYAEEYYLHTPHSSFYARKQRNE